MVNPHISRLHLLMLAIVVSTPAAARAEAVITGLGSGGAPTVSVVDADTLAQLSSFFAYDAGFTGGVRVAAGDVNGDGVPDIITGAGPGGSPHVKVFDGATGSELRSFLAFDVAFTGGVFVAAGDVNGDKRADIIVGADAGGGPQVKAFDAVTGAEIRSFLAYPAGFRGGVRVAAGDINGDGIADIITGGGVDGGAFVKVFDGVSSAQIRSFLAYGAFTGGVFVASGDVNGDGRDDIVTGPDTGGGPNVKVFDGLTNLEIRSFLVESGTFTGGIRVAARDINGDGAADIITGTGPGLAPHVAIFDGASVNGRLLKEFSPAAANVTGGVYVAATTTFALADTTPPVVTVPSSITVDATSPDGAVVTFEATAADPDDAAGPVTCVPASGSMIPIGVTMVACSSTDTHNNTGTASFALKVRTPAESLAVLIDAVEGNLHQSENLLANALRSIDMAQNSSSCNMLGGFINQANAQSGKTLDPDLAIQFTTTAGHIQAALACP